MISPYRNKRPPYELPSDIVYFLDWRYVQHGSVGWKSHDGKSVPMWGNQPSPPMRYEPRFLPRGINLKAVEANKSEPFLESDMFDGLFLTSCTVMQENGQYRLWYDCSPVEHIGDERYSMGGYNYVGYAESKDGKNWTIPSLGIIERNGSTNNSLVYGIPLTGEIGYHGGSVFRDPSSPDSERYKMIYQGHFTRRAREDYFKQRPDEVDAFFLEKPDKMVGLFGAVSPDGIHWESRPEPLNAQVSDTQNVCEYDTVLERYVVYCRNWFFNRRTIGRIIAPEFRRFPLSDEVIWPDPSMEPFDLWYCNAKTKLPGTDDYHVMFPMRWSIKNDGFDFWLISSPDNLTWSFVPGGPVCRLGEPGSWDGGVVEPGLGMVDLPEEQMGIPFVATPVPHKHPRRLPFGAIGWAWWPKGRLAALEAPVEGSFALWPLKTTKRRISINFKSAPGGSIRVRVLNGKGQPIDGRGLTDCDWLIGDHIEKEVSWQGNPDIGNGEEEPFTLFFEMRCAELYSVELK